MKHEQWHEVPYEVSTDPARLDLDVVHQELANTYWAKGIPKELVEKSVRHSLNFGVYLTASNELVGFARVVSDYATFAYLADVVVRAPYRSRGISKLLMRCVQAHPELQGLRRFCLGTRDAHGLYRQFGFEQNRAPENWMEIKVADIYLREPPVQQ